jgi:hypothetical protein
MWKNIVKPERPQRKICCMRIACWIAKGTNTPSEYVIIISFSAQKWLHESSSIYILCVSCFVSKFRLCFDDMLIGLLLATKQGWVTSQYPSVIICCITFLLFPQCNRRQILRLPPRTCIKIFVNVENRAYVVIVIWTVTSWLSVRFM